MVFSYGITFALGVQIMANCPPDSVIKTVPQIRYEKPVPHIQNIQHDDNKNDVQSFFDLHSTKFIVAAT